MNNNEARIKALITLWGWVSNCCEGIEYGELSDVLEDDVMDGRYSLEDAKKIQKAYKKEADLISKKIDRLMAKNSKTSM